MFFSVSAPRGSNGRPRRSPPCSCTARDAHAPRRAHLLQPHCDDDAIAMKVLLVRRFACRRSNGLGAGAADRTDQRHVQRGWRPCRYHRTDYHRISAARRRLHLAADLHRLHRPARRLLLHFRGGKTGAGGGIGFYSMLRHPYVYFEPHSQDHAGAEWARETFGTTGSPRAVVAVSGHRVRATTLSFAGQSIPIESCCGRGAGVRSCRPEYELLRCTTLCAATRRTLRSRGADVFAQTIGLVLLVKVAFGSRTGIGLGRRYTSG